MGTAFTIFLVAFAAAIAGSNALFFLWGSAHHTVGWVVFVTLFGVTAYVMAESKVRGASKAWEPRYQKIRKAVDSFSRRGKISP